jgi:hypothetical protein
MFTKYQDLYNILVDTTWKAYNNKPLTNRPRYLLVWAQKIKELPRYNSYQLELEDVRAQITLLWLCYEEIWKGKTKHNCSFKSYLIKRTLWDVRDWLLQESKIVDTDYYCGDGDLPEEESELDIHWLCYGGKNLTHYERYITYLSSAQHLPILKISDIVGRSRNIVAKDLVMAVGKLTERN